MTQDAPVVLRIPIPPTYREWRELHDALWSVLGAGFYCGKEEVLVSFESEEQAVQFKLTYL